MQTSYTPSLVDDTSTVGLMSTRLRKNVAKMLIGTMLLLDLPIIPIFTTSAHAAPGDTWVQVPVKPDPMMQNLNIPANAATQGMWSPVYNWPMNGLHNMILPDGKVLTFGSAFNTVAKNAWDQDGRLFDVWDPSLGFGANSHVTTYQPEQLDSFCTTAAYLNDGRLLITGGNANAIDNRRDTLGYGNGSTIYNPANNTRVTAQAQTALPRWYATMIALPDSRKIMLGGMKPYTEGMAGNPEASIAQGLASMTPEVFENGVWRSLPGAYSRDAFGPDYLRTSFPHAFVAPNGQVFGISADKMWYLDANANGGNGAITYVANFKQGYGNMADPVNVGALSNAVMYDIGKIIQLGGNGGFNGDGYRASNMATAFDINGGAPVLTELPRMVFPRRMSNSTVLANGQVVVTGGVQAGIDVQPVYAAEIWDSKTNTWRMGANAATIRSYHSITSLLANGTVISTGGGTPGPVLNLNAEIYYPPYLFKQVGGASQLAARPVIKAISGLSYNNNDPIQMDMASDAPISGLTLIGLSTGTHAFNNGQRRIPLNFNQNSMRLSATVPNANLTPPGYYQVVALDAAGVPSYGTIVAIGQNITPPNTPVQPYTPPNVGNVDVPVLNADSVATYNPLAIAGYTYKWSFGDGTPDTQYNASPYVQHYFANPGAYTVMLTSRSPQGIESRNTWVQAVATPKMANNATNSSPIISELELLTAGKGSNCANENGTCAIPAGRTATVWYGVNDKWASKANVTGGIACNNGAFGDPAPGIPKSCRYQITDGLANRIFSVNPDSDTVSVIDDVTKNLVATINVGSSPRTLAAAPDGRIWVTNKNSGTISIINQNNLTIAQTITLPRGSQPHGIAFGPAGGSAYVALEATGQLLKLDPNTGAQQGAVNVGINARHVAVTADGARVLVSRFITPPLPGEGTQNVDTTTQGGEVVVVNAGNMTFNKTVMLRHSDKTDNETQGSGIPNYLGAAAISPDGTTAWVPSKQDNIKRGKARNGLDLNFQNTVRAISSRIDLGTQTEDYAKRIDHDNSSLGSAAVYHPNGVYAFVALETSRQVAVINAISGTELFKIDIGRAPQGIALSPDGNTMYVQEFMERTVSAFDLSPLTQKGKLAITGIKAIYTGANENLPPQVVLGKQFFYDAKDTRLARDSYMSCASCHNDGGHDGRVWDFTGFGEGLRNTISLKGRAANGHGFMHWSANFDELQDFEGQIRTLAGGTGLMTDAQFNTGTRNQTLGDKKAGVSYDLDSMAAYVASLTTFAPSPNRMGDGSLTPAAAAGKTVFANSCASCHSGNKFTGSADGSALKDIGTINALSGKRLNGNLTGTDIPTLRDVWATAPYLHNGSAPTITAAVQAHKNLALNGTDLANVVEYVNQIGSDEVVPGLVANWKFNEGVNNVTADTAGNSGPLTFVNNAAWALGINGLGVQFNGGSGSTAGPVVNTAGNFAVSAWVKLDNLNGWQTFASQDGNAISGFWLQYSQYLGNKFAFTMSDADVIGSAGARAISTTTPVVGQWYHIVGVRDKAAGTMKIYVNGKLEGTTAYAGGWASNGSFNVARGKPNADSVAGTIDEVTVYNYAINDAEVANTYNTSTQNAAPAVSVATPLAGATYAQGTAIPLSATATDTDGNVTQVQYFDGTTLIGTANASPYQVNWANAAPGAHTITAKATDNTGAVTTSAAVTITVNSQATAFAGSWNFNGRTDADSSGNNRRLVFANSDWTPGVYDVGVKFNGVNSSGSTNAPVLNTADSFAVSAWVKLDNLNGWQTFVNQDGNAISGFWLQYSQYLGNKFAFAMSDADVVGSAGARAISTTTPVVGQWYHIVGVRDKAAGTMKIYVNGKLEGTTAYAGGWASNGSFNVGRGKYGAPNDWATGAIDEVNAYNYAISDAEVGNLYKVSSPVSTWKFNEGVNNVTADVTGNNKPLTFTNGTAWAQGVSGLGVQFNGGSGSTTGSVVNTAGNFAVSAWVKLDNLNGWQTFVNQDGNAISGFWLQYSQALGNKFAFAMSDADVVGSAGARAISTTTPVVGQWYHLVGVRDKAAGTMKLYVNGKLEGTTAYAGGGWVAFGSFNVGRGKYGAPNDWVAGAIDEVNAYNYAIGDADVSKLYNASSAVAAWKFNEGVNNVTADVTDNNKPLTFTNGTAWALGINGLGVQFNGGSGSTAGPVVNTAGNFAVSAWVKLDNLNGWQTFASQDGNAISGFWLQYSQYLGNKFAFTMSDADVIGSAGARAISTTTPVVGQWYHIVGVRDKAAGTMKIYVNGKLEGTTAYAGGWASNGSFNVGRAKPNADAVAGAIDEAAAYGYALSDAQVANLYQAGF